MIPQAIVNQVEKKGISLLWSRIKSKSPKAYTEAVQYGGIAASAFGAVAGYLKSTPNLFPHEHLAMAICGLIAMFFGGVAVTASTTTKDPKLVSKELKDAIITDAAPIGPPVDAR